MVLTEGPGLFDAPPPGDRGGTTYQPEWDYTRLNRQAADVWLAMRDMAWHTLAQLAETTDHPEASISARLRDFRKEQFGGHDVQRERVPGGNGLFRYRLVPTPRQAAIIRDDANGTSQRCGVCGKPYSPFGYGVPPQAWACGEHREWLGTVVCSP